MCLRLSGCVSALCEPVFLDGEEVTMCSVNSVRGFSAVQWTESPGLGLRAWF